MIAVARQGDQSIAQVARSFGLSESCLSRWLRIADREDGTSTDPVGAPVPNPPGELEAEKRAAPGAKQLERSERDPAPRDHRQITVQRPTGRG